MRLRLRQVCLIARGLERTVSQLTQVFGIEVSIRDPNVEKHGLRNAVMPIGSTFLEVVSPFRAGTTGGRYLDRRDGDGGYMVMLDTDDIAQWRPHLAAVDATIAYEADYGAAYQALHLHPKQTGGALLSIDHCPRARDARDAWFPAGPDWQCYRHTDVVMRITGAELQSDEPERLASRWSAILDRPLKGNVLALDSGLLRFVRATDGRSEGLGGLDIAIKDRGRVLQEATRLGLSVADDVLTVCGTRFYLT